ncbi:MAG: ABC transporter permease [Candidatus Bipolaricaulis anaerobius]|nr:ABC transporter permease [Candidatus Bipolaricaulis anaerobius]
MWRDDLRGIWAIVQKDMRTYYLKPPAVSWGIVFPITWILAFYLRSPRGFAELVPGLIAMTALFSTTAAEAVVINFELRLGSLERLLLAPISVAAVFLGKVLGGALFGLLMTAAVALGSILALGVSVNVVHLVLVLIPALLAFSSLGALLCVLVREVFEAQTLLNLPRFLMIFLSGVVYPVSAMPWALQVLARVLPLTYAVDGLRAAFFQGASAAVPVDALVLLGFALAFVFPGIRLLARRFE